MDGSRSFDPIYVEEFPTTEGKLPKIRRFKHISPQYFEAMGNKLLAGRDFTWNDILDTRPVVIVSRNLAAEYWPSPSLAIGKRIRESPKSPWREIVGVVADERDDGLDRPASTTAFWPVYKKDFWGQPTNLARYLSFAIRSRRAGTSSFTRDVEQAVWAVNPQLPLANVKVVTELVADSMARTSFTLVMMSLSSAMALLLGIVGIYGVISYSIAQRTKEIGIRMALGAPGTTVERMFLRHGLILAAIGVSCGIAISLPLSRLMQTLLYGTAPTDPATYLCVAAFLLVSAGLAAWLPARRASRIAPVEALRGD
jgi:predicted permease